MTKTNHDLMAESLTYERAANELQRICTRFFQQMEECRLASKPRGESIDPYMPLLYSELRKLLNRLQNRSNELWRKLEKQADINEDGCRALAQAVVVDAVKSYEKALCRGDHIARLDVELFARDDAAYYTDADVSVILHRIRQAVPEFQKRARRNLKTILQEPHKPVGQHSTHCPLCGGDLYAVTDKRKTIGTEKIKCSGCSLFCIVEAPE